MRGGWCKESRARRTGLSVAGPEVLATHVSAQVHIGVYRYRSAQRRACRYASPCQDGGQALPSESAATNEFRRLPAQATSPVTSGCS